MRKRGKPLPTPPVVCKPRGRPPTYNEGIAAQICARITLGQTVYEICLLDGMPSETALYEWLKRYPDFAEQYARAREESAHRSADKILEVAKKVEIGDLAPDAGRVVIDAHKWSAGKRKPKVYGDRQTVDLGDETMKQLSDDRLNARVSQLLGKAGIAVAPRGEGEA